MQHVAKKLKHFEYKKGRDIQKHLTHNYHLPHSPHGEASVHLTFFTGGMDDDQAGGVLIDVKKTGECIEAEINLYLDPAQAQELAAILLKHQPKVRK